MKEVKLGRTGLVALVDDGDFERVSKHRWYPDLRKGGLRYAKGCVNGRWTRLHRFVLELQPRIGDVDHEDGDGFNNQRKNLIYGTRAENVRTGRKHLDSKSRHRGIYQSKGRWVAHLWLGTFDTEGEAAEAYLKAFQGYFGHPPRHPSRAE